MFNTRSICTGVNVVSGTKDNGVRSISDLCPRLLPQCIHHYCKKAHSPLDGQSGFDGVSRSSRVKVTLSSKTRYLWCLGVIVCHRPELAFWQLPIELTHVSPYCSYPPEFLELPSTSVVFCMSSYLHLYLHMTGNHDKHLNSTRPISDALVLRLGHSIMGL